MKLLLGGAFVGLTVSVVLGAYGYNSVELEALLAFATVTPFAIELFKQNRSNG